MPAKIMVYPGGVTREKRKQINAKRLLKEKPSVQNEYDKETSY